MRLLLISNSTNPGEEYLGYPKNVIRDFLGNKPVKALFIPWAAVTFTYDEYERRVSERFREIGHEITSVHRFPDAAVAVKSAEAIVVGGGNTWKLLKLIQENNIIDEVRRRIKEGTPYIGWSAGSNVACPTIMTTNDMPVIQPASFEAFRLVPFQINPHYIDGGPEGFAGETREQRIQEFIELNPDVYVAGLREGTMLRVENETLQLTGNRSVRLFLKGTIPVEAGEKDDLSFLLKRRT